MDILELSAISNGHNQNVDISSNTLVALSIKLGGSVSNTELTKAILDNLVALQNGSDFADGTNSHLHDGRYYTEGEIGSNAPGSSGASLVGVSGLFTNYFPTSADAQAHFEAINTALGAAGTSSFLDSTFRINNDPDNTRTMMFSVGGVSLGATRILTMPDFNVDLGNLSNSNIAPAAAIAYSKLNLASSIVNSDISNSAAIAYSKLSLSNSVVNADIAAGAAIAYSKLDLVGSIVNADIASGAAIALNKLAALAVNRALVSDGSGIVSASSTTATEIGYVSGATSNLQAQINAKISSSEKGAANGVAPLDSGSKIPVAYLPNSVMELQGFWNANTNTPTLADGVGNPGDIWEVDTAGTTNFGNGPITFAVGDWAVYAADNKWHKSINSNAVTSVNGQTGTVSLNTDNISEGSNLYFTTERAQDAVGSALANTTTISLTYNDSGNAITADINALSITNALISASAGIVYSKLSLTNSIVNADIASGAAIAYSKLNLSASIVNADVAVGAAIAYSKLALTGAIVNADIASGAAIVYSKLSLTNSIVNADIGAAAAIAYSKLNLTNSVGAADLTTGVFDQVTITGGNGTPAVVQATSGVRVSKTAGESFAANTSFAVRFALSGETAGRVYKADKDASSTNKYNVIGVIPGGSSISAGGSATVTVEGTVTLGASDVNFSAGDIGKEVYLTASGGFSTTAPSATNEAVYVIGFVEDVNKIFVTGKHFRYIN